MRIFVAGASGVIGIRLVPLLVSAGHEVEAMTRSPQKAEALRALGARPVVCDVYDRDALVGAVVALAPDTVLHQVTDLPDAKRDLSPIGLANARIRREGTDNLLAAVRAAEVTRFLAQSVAWRPEGASAAAVAYLEEATLAVGGVVLRYGRFYGPGTWFVDELPAPPRIRVEEAARRTVAALEAPSGVLTIVEEPW
jgi:nucleoside-diphosphate-sugar epimerase